MLHYGLAFLAVVSVSFAQPAILLEPKNLANSCTYPNGTATTANTFNCDASHKISVTSVQALKKNRQPLYPINMEEPIILVLEAENRGDEYKTQTVDVVVRKYHAGLYNSACSWITIPTFGLLNNINGCKYANNCPLQKGKLKLEIPLDLSAFAGIISMMAGNSAYELEIKMYTSNPVSNHREEIACVKSQAKIA